jgi:protein-S-isoprenylcysteine O-methyltransferase Ste14
VTGGAAPAGPEREGAGTQSKAVAFQRWTQWLTSDFGGGPRPWRLNQVIDFQKAGTPLLLLALMALYDAWSTREWLYFALHGGYGLVWLIKDLAFPDPAWQKRITIGGALLSFVGVLGWYWLFGWLLISGAADATYPLPDAAWFGLCTLLCLLGCVVMIASDAQKYFVLRERSGLITDGMFRYIRHPNYLGEIMVYASFAMMVWHWLPWLVLAWVWLGVFAVNMIVKEQRMSRHSGWTEYRSRTAWLVPGLL